MSGLDNIDFSGIGDLSLPAFTLPLSANLVPSLNTSANLNIPTMKVDLGDRVKKQIEEENRMRPETAIKAAALALGPGLLIGGLIGGGKGAVIGALINAVAFGAWATIGGQQMQNDPYMGLKLFQRVG